MSNLGIAASDIVFKNVSVQSSKYVVAREEGKNSVAIVDTATKNVLRLPVAVDSAIMNPVSKVIALRAGNNLQIYNLEMKTKMKTTVMEAGVQFWRWLDAKTIAIVTDSAVFHWSMDGDAQPTKMFDRAAYEGAVQIINYRASADQKWSVETDSRSRPLDWRCLRSDSNLTVLCLYFYWLLSGFCLVVSPPAPREWSACCRSTPSI